MRIAVFLSITSWFALSNADIPDKLIIEAVHGNSKLTFATPEKFTLVAQPDEFRIEEQEQLILSANTGADSLEVPVPLEYYDKTNTVSVPNLKMSGNEQWKLVSFNSFDNKDGVKSVRKMSAVHTQKNNNRSWSNGVLGSCGEGTDTFLGGHCKFAGTFTTTLVKQLPPHK
eukprot:GHVR01140562.1.p1 GENE.GHVR01140562.1~~GHVR01140562.1.p1  ORF type:complete len:171 (+),score=2.86 GHVR01140562.1:1424-1936(+)